MSPIFDLYGCPSKNPIKSVAEIRKELLAHGITLEMLIIISPTIAKMLMGDIAFEVDHVVEIRKLQDLWLQGLVS